MVLSISTQGGFDFGIASDSDNILDFSQLPSGEISQLQGSLSTDAIVLLGGNDIAMDDAAGRIYFGNAGNDVINGGDGEDTMLGGQDNDMLTGESGNDVLSGDRGFDTLTGGGGADQFLLAASAQQGSDIITDFQDGVDKIRLPDGVSFANLQVQASGTSTLILQNGEQLAVLSDVASSSIGRDDFVGGSSSPPTPSGDPGDTLSTALNLGALSGNFSYEEFVGTTDRNDFYRFDIPATSNFSYRIDGLSDTIYSKLIFDANNNGEVESSEDLIYDAGSRVVSGSSNLGAGTYFLQVYTGYSDDNTSYSLSLETTPRTITTPADPGNQLSEALNLGSLSGTINFTDFVGTVDRNDFYRFDIPATSNFSYRIDGLSDTIYSKLIFDANNNGEVESSEDLIYDAGSSVVSGSSNLGAGTYFLQVYTGYSDDNTSYSLSLSA